MNSLSDNIVSDRVIREIYGVSPSTTWRLRKRPNDPLPHFFVGGQVRYRLSDVERFFEKNGKQKQIAAQNGKK